MKYVALFFVCMLVVACTEKSTEAESFDASKVCPETQRGTFVDERDGQEYRYTTIGDQIWMAENLNYAVGSEIKDMYPSSCSSYKDNCDGRGLLYPFSYIKSACPAGWHLPKQEEWDELYDKMGGIDVAGERLKAFEGWTPLNREDPRGGTDDCGFSLKPALASGMNRDGYAAELWSASLEELNGNPITEYFYSNKSFVRVDYDTDWQYYSIRCVKN